MFSKYGNECPICMRYYDNGNLKYIEYDKDDDEYSDEPFAAEYYETGELKYSYHNLEDNLKVIRYYKDGNKQLEQYYVFEELHREDGPAEIFYNNDGTIKYEKYFISDNEIDLSKYDNIDSKQMVILFSECSDIDSLLELKLIANVKFK